MHENRTHWRPAARRAGVLALLTALAVVGCTLPRTAATAATADSFVFGAGGDHASGSKASAVMQSVGAADLDFFLSLGDLSYDTIPPAEWCTFVKDNINVGAGRPAGDAYGNTFPFQLTEGNHDLATYDEYLPCLPDRMSSTVMPGSSYGRDYFYDYPAVTPLARFIVAAPGVEYAVTEGSPQYQWLSDTIDQARAAGIKWVIVGQHKNYVTAGEKDDEIGAAFFNLMVQKKVDLLLQGHEHNYQRSHQLGLGADCPAVPKEIYQASCVVADGSSGTYRAGAGTVVLVNGLAGQTARTAHPEDPEAPYFAKIEGDAAVPTYGFQKITVTADSLTSTFVNSSTTGFSDEFTISRSGVTPSPPTTTTLDPVADSTIKPATPTRNYGSATALQVDNSPVEQTLLKYVVPETPGRTIKGARLRMYVTNPSKSGADFFRTSDTSWAEDTVTWANAPAADAAPFASLGAVGAGVWVDVDASALIQRSGTYSIRATSTASDGVDFGSREHASGGPQLVLTLEPVETSPALPR